MQIVIDIDEGLYKKIYSEAEIMIYGGMRSGKTLLATLLRSIRNGTPIPKGHGRLIDADVLEWYGCTSEAECTYKNRKCKDCDMAECSKRQFDSISTIIEATEEQE